MYRLKDLKNAIKDRIKRLQPNQRKTAELVLKIIAGVLCLAIFVCGCWFGSINLDSAGKSSGIVDTIEKSKLIFPLIAAVLGWLFVTLLKIYVEGSEEKYQNEKDESEQKHQKEKLEIDKRYQSEILKLKQDMDKDSSYRKEQELEFLLYFQDYGKQFDNFDSTTFCNAVIELHQTGQLKKAVDNYIKKLKGRDEALEGLSKIFAEEKNKSVLQGLVGQACNHTLNIQKSQTWAEPFYKDIMLSLKWVYCSIKYGENLKIKPFIIPESLGEEGRELYPGKETYIEALKYIKEKSLKNKVIQGFFTTPDSIIIVEEYLNKLIDILKLG
jgi:hypothetical protein